MRAWYLADEKLEDYQSPNEGEKVSLNTLSSLGVLHWFIEPETHEDDSMFKTIVRERNYVNHDVVSS